MSSPDSLPQRGGCAITTAQLKTQSHSSSTVICSRPDSTLWHVSNAKVDKSAQFKSKKIGALNFGTLYPIESLVLSVSTTHLILLNHAKNKILSYEQLLPQAQESTAPQNPEPLEMLHHWNARERELTILRKVGLHVVSHTYKAMNLKESLDALAAEFELKAAVKMVVRYRAL